MSPLIRLTRRTFRSLRIRNYRRYFFSQIVSMTGTWAQSVAQIWLVLQITHSGVALGIVTGLQFAPILLFGAWTGLLADRVDKRRLVMATQASAAALALALGVLTTTGVVELWMIYALAFGLGIATAIEIPARQSFVVEMVGEEDLVNAVGLNSAVFTSARIAGPALAAILISTAGIAWCFYLNAVSFIVVILALQRMDADELQPAPRVPRSKGQIREGLRYVRSRPDLLLALVLMAVVGTLAFNFRVILPLMATEVFGGGAGAYGTLSAIMAAGTVGGALAAAATGKPDRRVLIGSAIAFGALIVVAALAPSIVTEAIVLVPIGTVSMIFIATCNATLQLGSSDLMRGRVMALYAMLFLGTTPIGSPIVGWLSEAIGPRATFAATGIATLAAALGAWAWLGRSAPARTGGGDEADEFEVTEAPAELAV
ncbi:MAG TPA: MFS transporter [Actinomycetota bacterium]